MARAYAERTVRITTPPAVTMRYSTVPRLCIADVSYSSDQMSLTPWCMLCLCRGYMPML